jgi:hypothetical protein
MEMETGKEGDGRKGVSFVIREREGAILDFIIIALAIVLCFYFAGAITSGSYLKG